MADQTGNIFNQIDAEQKQATTPPSAQPAPTQPAQLQGGNIFNQIDAEHQQEIANTETETDPRKTGEITNDVGQKVIVPKDGESFSDTLKRAVQYHKSLTPEQQQAAIDAEAKTIPAKTAQTLGAAATIGATGPAALALPGELINAAKASPEALKAVQEMAKAHPEAAKFIKKVLTGAIAGHSMGHTAVGAGLGLLWDLL